MIVLINDGSFNGLLTCIYECYYSYKEVSEIFSILTFNDNFLYEKKYIETDDLKASKVYSSLLTKTGFETLENIYHAYLSDVNNCETLILNYIKMAFRIGTNINHHIYNATVKNILNLKNKVLKEAHSFQGFVRFSSINNKFLYSSIEPDHNILELISIHFTQRFSNENFIIHDIKRELALIHDSKLAKFEIIKMPKTYYEALKGYKEDFNDLWKTYYTATTINLRINPKLQKSHMPKRYWKHLYETK